MSNVFLMGSAVTLKTRLLDITGTEHLPAGPVAVRVFKGGDQKASGVATSLGGGLYQFTYHPSAWETGDYRMSFLWDVEDEAPSGAPASGEPASGGSGAPVALPLLPMSLGIRFSLVASDRYLRPLDLPRTTHPCDFPWYQNINLTCEFDEMIQKQGKWFVLFHKTSEIYCTCWNAVEGSARRNCPYCQGTGHPHQEVVFRGRDEMTQEREGTIFNLGRELYATHQFFVPMGFLGKKGDQIWVVNWKDPSSPERGWTAPPLKRFGITYVQDFYGDNHDGVLTYKLVLAQENPLHPTHSEIT